MLNTFLENGGMVPVLGFLDSKEVDLKTGEALGGFGGKEPEGGIGVT